VGVEDVLTWTRRLGLSHGRASGESGTGPILTSLHASLKMRLTGSLPYRGASQMVGMGARSAGSRMATVLSAPAPTVR